MIKQLLLLPFCLSSLFINAQTKPANSGSLINNFVPETRTNATEFNLLNFNVFTAPEKDLIVIQKKNLNTVNTDIELLDSLGRLVQKTTLYQGSTIAFFDTKILYDGNYMVKISDGEVPITQKITIIK